MSLAIGGFRGYDGFQGLGLDSYEAGDLEMSIADRDVFDQDAQDDSEVEQEKWTAVKTAVDAGADLKGVLKSMGLSDSDITTLVPKKEERPLPPTGGLQIMGGLNATEGNTANPDGNTGQPLPTGND
jgi:hypothetical protein